MNHVEGLDELVLDSDDVLIESIDKFSKELLLVPHFNILINLLKDWKKIRLVDLAGNVVEDISALLKVVISERAQQRLFERARELDKQVTVEISHQESILLRHLLELRIALFVLTAL